MEGLRPSAQNAPSQDQPQPMDHDSDIEEYEPVIMTFYAPDTSDEPPEGPPIPPKIERKVIVQKRDVAVQVLAPNPDNPIVLDDDDEPVIIEPEPIAPPAEPDVVPQEQQPNPNPPNAQEPEIVELEPEPQPIAPPAEPAQPAVDPPAEPALAEPAVAEPARPAVAPPAEPAPAEPAVAPQADPAVLPEPDAEMEHEDVEEPVQVRRSTRRRRASTPPGVRGSGRPLRRSCKESSPKRPRSTRR
ncbi:hypothetical protein B9Z55_012875 [Caenorhabditis nigoni]|uniref:Uncharacterized protein n=1 Tax=Caenorhabditis nigoni TaxID=1611254 RepID=A0A2G5TZ73_9PELO|nr:hypothetical protein B9Z55_012875 [Caenorhabditis nigoni]